MIIIEDKEYRKYINWGLLSRISAFLFHSISLQKEFVAAKV